MVLCDITSAIFQFPPHKYISLSYLCHSSMFVVVNSAWLENVLERMGISSLPKIYRIKKTNTHIHTVDVRLLSKLETVFGETLAIYDLYKRPFGAYMLFGFKCTQTGNKKLWNSITTYYIRTHAILNSIFSNDVCI